jgi:tetratricopeptide (TPR) repeat protein
MTSMNGPSRARREWLAILAGLILPVMMTATRTFASGDFEQANRLYEEERFAEAVAAYERIAATRGVSSALLYNLGNAAFKSGQIGRAIAAYRRAELLTPRDPDLRANLRFARDTVTGGGWSAGPPWRDWMVRLTADEWTILATTPLTVFFLLLWIAQLRPALGPMLRGYTLAVGVTATLLVALTAFVLQHRFTTIPGVVVTPEAVVRYGPVEESQSRFTLRDGAEVNVLDAKGPWIQITDSSRGSGWARRDQLVTLSLCSPAATPVASGE